MKKTVIFDFDGVIHSYTSGWQGADVIPDPPVPGIREAIAEIREAGYEVVVVSTRCYQNGGIKAITEYLIKHDIPVDRVTAEKPPAILTIDDRAICFDGRPENLLEKIQNFEPWNKKET
jgi:beta-phosphoglucomutase-like phosphatase (HAD superfamily)